ncbi:MAG: cation:proton antiporter subunit C [Alphaproteobacteria bacterium]
MDPIGHYNYWVAIALMMAGFYVVIARGNLLKKLVGLNIFQTAVFLLYITIAKVLPGTAPIAKAGLAPDEYANPLPHVLILTAIVVLVATTALGLALVVRIKETYGTVEEDEILKRDEE